MVQTSINGTCDLSIQVGLEPEASDLSLRIQLPPQTPSCYFEVGLSSATSNFTIHLERAPAPPGNNSTTPKRPSVYRATTMSVTKVQKASVVQTQTASASKGSFTGPEDDKPRARTDRWLRDIASSPKTGKSAIRVRLPTPVHRQNEEVYQGPFKMSGEANSSREFEEEIGESFCKSVTDAELLPRTSNLPIRVKLPPARFLDDSQTSQAIPRQQNLPRPFLIPGIDSSECSDSAYETVEPASSSDSMEYGSSSNSVEYGSSSNSVEYGSSSNSMEAGLSSGYYGSERTQTFENDTTDESESGYSGSSSSVDSEHQRASIGLEARLDEMNAQIASYKLGPRCLETEEHLLLHSERLLRDIQATLVELEERSRESN